MLTIEKAEQYAIQNQRELHLFSAWLQGFDARLESGSQDDQDQQEMITGRLQGKHCQRYLTSV